MLLYFRKYPVSLVLIAVILGLSLCRTPDTGLAKIPGIDKVAHLCMYGGLCMVLWFEYLHTHTQIEWRHFIWGGIVAPVVMGGCVELAQSCSAYDRTADWLDFAANCAGIGLGNLFGYFVLRPWCWPK